MPTKRRTKVVRVPATTNNITKGIINYINSRTECFAFRVNSGGVYDKAKGVFRTAAKSGVSDIVACIRGRFVAIEVKNKITKDRLRPAQAEFGVDVQDSLGNYIIAYGYPDFVTWFESIHGKS